MDLSLFGGAPGPVAFVFHDGGTTPLDLSFHFLDADGGSEVAPELCAADTGSRVHGIMLEVRDEKSTLGSGPSGLRPVRVQVPPWALHATYSVQRRSDRQKAGSRRSRSALNVQRSNIHLTFRRWSTGQLTLPRFPGHLVKIHCRSRISGCGSCWQRGALSKRRWKSGVDFHGRVSFHS